jgi:hypothetical protein
MPQHSPTTGAYLSIDVMDISGEQQLDVEHNLYKTRLDPRGNEIDMTPHETLGEDNESVALALELSKLDPERCESCYGAENAELKCCNNCANVREAYRVKGWAFNNAEGIVQCEREGWSDKMKEMSDEGCNMHGFLLVNKVRAPSPPRCRACLPLPVFGVGADPPSPAGCSSRGDLAASLRSGPTVTH